MLHFYKLALSLVTICGVLPLLSTSDSKTGKVRTLHLHKRVGLPGTDSAVVREVSEQWDMSKTAVIICDMWDRHWCSDASKRVDEMAGYLNNVVSIARADGALIVHAPSDCMDYYENTPARSMARKYHTEATETLTGEDKLDTELSTSWPVDDSDGGCATTVDKEHRAWKKQHDAIIIKNGDAVSDDGIEISGLFAARGIKNVVLMGVHTNMCIIRRSFGLRSLSRMGMHTVLMRDLTDAMYNPLQAPFVSHKDGTTKVIHYIEQYIAPSVTSQDLTGEAPFEFASEKK